MSARVHTPCSLSLSQIFGPLAMQHRIQLLHHLGSIRFVLNINESRYWAGPRHRGRVEHFVKIIKAHAEDEYKKSHLKQLSICIAREGSNYMYAKPARDSSI